MAKTTPNVPKTIGYTNRIILKLFLGKKNMLAPFQKCIISCYYYLIIMKRGDFHEI